MYNAPILKKSLSVIKLIIEENKPLGVTEVSKKLSLSKSTVFGILKALEEEGFVIKYKSTKKYFIGQELFDLSKKLFKGEEITTVAKPYLENLLSLVDETVFLCVRERNKVKVLDAIETKKALKISSPIGIKFPITASVMCKAFLSPLNNDDIRNFLKEKKLPRYTDNSITDIEQFIDEIERTRSLGYSLDIEEYIKGIRAVASLIYSANNPVGAICVVGFSNSMSNEKLPAIIKHLKMTANQVSERLTQTKSAAVN